MADESIFFPIFRELAQRAVAAFIDFDKPIIGLVNGPAVGAAVTLLPLFDIVWAADTATFSTPFVSLAQSAEGTSTYTFPFLMEHVKASELLLFGRKLTAAEAYEKKICLIFFFLDFLFIIIFFLSNLSIMKKIGFFTLQ